MMKRILANDKEVLLSRTANILYQLIKVSKGFLGVPKFRGLPGESPSYADFISSQNRRNAGDYCIGLRSTVETLFYAVFWMKKNVNKTALNRVNSCLNQGPVQA